MSSRLAQKRIPNVGYGRSSTSCTMRSDPLIAVYSSVRFIDDQIHSVSGSGVAAHMVMPGTAYEGSSGGPFFRDINNQGTAQQEFYWYMNSGHTQTEAFRQGLHGPYALWFTTGSKPAVNYDLTFWDTVNPTGYVKSSGRGYVKGKAIDVPSAYASKVVIGWSNSVAQYWTRADASTGNFYSPAMKPGTYTMTLYKGELAVGTQSVAVTAAGTTTSNVHDTNALDVCTYLLPLYHPGHITNDQCSSHTDSILHLEDRRI
jgi:rhamnogalacturonan endolyase